MNILPQEESMSLPQALRQIDRLHKQHTEFLRIRLNHSVDILSWIEQYKQQPFVYWSSRNKKEEWGGIDLAEAHYHSIQDAQNRLKDLHPGIRAFGGMSFSKNSDGWGEFGSQTFWIPKICIYRKGEHYFLESLQRPIDTPHPAAPCSLLPDRYIPSQADWTNIIGKTYEDLDAAISLAIDFFDKS